MSRGSWTKRKDGDETVWQRGDYEVTVVGTSALGTPTQWGVSLKGEAVRSICRGRQIARTFNRVRDAKRFVELELMTPAERDAFYERQKEARREERERQDALQLTRELAVRALNAATHAELLRCAKEYARKAGAQ